MIRLLSPNRTSYYNAVVEEFNNSKKPMTTDIAFGFSSEKYSWIADFLFKHNNNKLINKHTGYVSFFSDRSIMHQEYYNVTQITDVYPFLNSEQYSPHTYELTTKQYRSVSQNYAEYDLIEFIDKSGLLEVSPGTVTIRHWAGRHPLYKAVGFMCDMNDETVPREGYNRYVWAREYSTSHIPILHHIFDDYSTVTLPELDQLECGVTGNSILAVVSAGSDSFRYLLDYKIALDSREPSRGTTYEYDDVVCGSNNYEPYVPFVNFARANWESTSPEMSSDGGDVLTYYPEIKDAGRVIPKKIYSSFTGQNPNDPIKMLVNPGVHLKESDDQSRVSFSACKYMFMWNNRYILKTMDPDFPSNVMLEGIDIDTERNRRYSAVVTTQPYMITTPLADGQVVDFRFINGFGGPVKFSNESAFYETPDMHLQIKAPYAFIKELDDQLNRKEYNDDIIHTVTINFPDPVRFNSASGFYTTFSNLIRRQGACLDDLVGGVIGTGVRKGFYIDDLAVTGFYSENKMKVAGIGWGAKTLTNGAQINFINVYCSNYSPISSYLPGDTSRVPQSSPSYKLFNYTSYDKVEEKELFRPMLKLPGINGYVKILERNNVFKVFKAPDGDNVVTYNVEFPFCPGSTSERINMDFTGGYKAAQVYYKQSYIKAGSHKLSGSYYDGDNDRYAFVGDKGFTFSTVNLTPANYNSIEYDGFVYPAFLVNNEKLPNFLSLIRPADDDFSHMGTYVLELNQDAPGEVQAHLSHDVRINSLIDNRVWKFGEKYSSYICRENPTYIADIDVSSLREVFNQKNFNGVPDKKRWLYSYFSGFAKTEDNKSDIIIEIWDGTWKPLNPISTDTTKIGGRVVYDKICIIGDVPPVDEGDGITSFVISDSDFTKNFFSFPEDVMTALRGMENAVLKYSDVESYHVIYAEEYSDLNLNMIKLYVKKDFADIQSLFIENVTVVEIGNPPADYVSILSMCNPKYMISENQTFVITSSEKYQNNYITKYLDINELENYSFRVRVSRKKEFPADGTVMQYMGSRTVDDHEFGNFPWWKTGVYDTAFSYKKINVQESVKKFAMTYFKTASK